MNARPSQQDIQNNPYQILGLPDNASYDEVKNSYKKLVLQYHPDRVKMNTDGASDAEMSKRIASAAEKFIDIQEAYELIEEQYRRSLPAQNQPNNKKDEYTYTHIETPDIAKDAVVVKEARVKVYLPIYVIGKVIDNGIHLGIRITMPELEDPSSRFTVLREKINKQLSHCEYQVGIDEKEVDAIINQHSWYKDSLISFVGYVEILLPLYHLNPRAGESISRDTPYFSIKAHSEIGLADITAFYATDNKALGAYHSAKVNEFIEAAKQGKIVNMDNNTQPVILPVKFDYDQPLDKKELIEDALAHYRKEYEVSVEYNTSHWSTLEDIKKLQAIHHEDISPTQKLEDIGTKVKIEEYGGRFKKIVNGMTAYYQRLSAQETQQIESVAPSPSLTSMSVFGDRQAPENNMVDQQYSTQTKLKSSLQTFLTSEINEIQLRLEAEKNSKSTFANKLLGWIHPSSSQPTTNTSATTGYESQDKKIDKLQAALNWLQGQESISDTMLDNLKLLIHSICALKRNVDPRQSKSQTHCEEMLHIHSKPVLSADDLTALNSAHDVELLCQLIDSKLKNHSTAQFNTNSAVQPPKLPKLN